MTPDEITINNAIGLLDELIHNGSNNRESLIAWYESEKELIKSTLSELKEIEDSQ